MTAYAYTRIDGRRVNTATAHAFALMKADFERAFPGLTLVISDGTRTRAEQTELFLAHYRVQASGNGPFGDVRYWQGRRYVRVSGTGTIAAPGMSNHEEDGPSGPRSLDIRDTGKDAGVTVLGSKRDKWMVANAHKYGFENEGHGFAHGPGFDLREAWHKKFTGKLAVEAPKPAPKPAGKPAAKPAPAPTSVRKGSKGALVKSVQAKLKKVYPLYAGKLVVDGIFGAATEKAVKEFQRRSGLAADGIVGPATRKKLGV